MAASAVAAYLSGWSNALELVRRTDLTMPTASSELHRAMAAAVRAIEAATAAVLADED